MNAILSIDSNYGIGYKGELLFNCREDLLRFKELTLGKTVVMGRKTFNSLPGQRPLPGRRNIIMSTDENLKIDGATVCRSIEELTTLLADTPKEDVFVIGGEVVYRALLPLCSTIYITRFEAKRKADTFFPNIDRLGGFEISEQSPRMMFGEIPYSYITYKRI